MARRRLRDFWSLQEPHIWSPLLCLASLESWVDKQHSPCAVAAKRLWAKVRKTQTLSLGSTETTNGKFKWRTRPIFPLRPKVIKMRCGVVCASVWWGAFHKLLRLVFWDPYVGRCAHRRISRARFLLLGWPREEQLHKKQFSLSTTRNKWRPTNRRPFQWW